MLSPDDAAKFGTFAVRCQRQKPGRQPGQTSQREKRNKIETENTDAEDAKSLDTQVARDDRHGKEPTDGHDQTGPGTFNSVPQEGHGLAHDWNSNVLGCESVWLRIQRVTQVRPDQNKVRHDEAVQLEVP